MTTEGKRSGTLIVVDSNGNKEKWIATLFMIHTKDSQGRAAICKMIADDDHKINLAGGEEFMVAYVLESMLTPKQ